MVGYRLGKRSSLAGLQSGFSDKSMLGAAERREKRLGSPAGQVCAVLSEDGICGSVSSRLSEPSRQQEPLEALEVFFEKAASPQI